MLGNAFGGYFMTHPHSSPTDTLPPLRIAVLPGDGIGPEVVESALAVLDAVGFRAEYVRCDVGWRWWREEGEALPARTLDAMRTTRCALFGAITSKPASEAQAELSTSLRNSGRAYRSPIVRLRQQFDLSTNLRPCRVVGASVAAHSTPTLDVLIVRENTEGLYAGVEVHPTPPELLRELVKAGAPAAARFAETLPDDLALSVRVSTRSACERIVRSAFRIAEARGRSRVTLAEKPNILRATGGLMTDAARAVAREFPDIAFEELNVDAVCMLMVTHPERFSVIVSENMFGDILSDLGAGITGGPGFAASANLGDSYAIFEPVHGSAPDIAGTGKANPIACVLAAALMVGHLGDRDKQKRIEHAVDTLVRDKRVGTPDMGLPHTTQDVTLELVRLVN